MKRRLIRISFAVAIGLATLAGAIWVLSKTLSNREQFFQARPLRYWVAQMKSQDPGASKQAELVLNQVIIPQLTESMFHDTNDSKLRKALVENLNELPGILIGFTPAEGRRATAAAELGDFGAQAGAAIPALILALKGHDEVVRGPAAKALGEIHGQPEVVIPLLISVLDDNELNDEAAEALGNFGPLAKAAVPKLIPLLKAPDKDLHFAVVDALKRIDPDAAATAGVK